MKRNRTKSLMMHFVETETSDESDFQSDASEEHELLTLIDNSSDSSNTSTESLKPRRKLHRIENYINVVDSYDDTEFKENFRLKRSTCDYLIQKIIDDAVLPSHQSGREKISPKRAVCITIWYLVNTETFRQISDRFNITKSSAHRIISKIINYFVSHSRDYIKWPDEASKQIIKKKFEEKKGLQGVLGAIDGSHIPIKKPNSRYAHVYYNRKGYYSILLQAVCDHRKKFIDVFCGEAGSIHDARLLKKSSIYVKGFSGLMGNDFLLGDSAYPCLNWLIPPFKDNGHLTENQKVFNYRHSSTRIVIENAFGLLKGRFRRLKFFENESIVFVVKCVITATVLHNICIDNDDEIEADPNELDDEFDERFVASVSGIHFNQNKRNELFERMFGTQP